MTLPLIHAMAGADAPTRRRLREIVENGHVDGLVEVQAAIAAASSLDYSRTRAAGYARAAELALGGFGENDSVSALRGLARYAVDRDH